MQIREVYILGAARTPIGSFGGMFRDVAATRLGAIAMKAALSKAGVDPGEIDEVILGCVLQANLGQAPARQASRAAGLPDKVICTTVNKVCSSGLKAIMQGAGAIALGDADIIVAGGMESMSNAPFYADSLRWGNKYGNTSFIDGLAKDGLSDAYDGKAMGCSADLCASECGISRQQQDEYAIESYRRSQAAWNAGNFNDEVVPVDMTQRNGEVKTLFKDEEPFNVNFDKIPLLRPVFGSQGTVTAANASTINDGAAAVVLCSKEKMKELSLKPVARIISYADAEQAPEWFTTTPAMAVPKAVKKAGLLLDQIDFFEISEAFSVVAIENTRRMNLDPSKVNVYGGAVSLGHPLGCSGARLIVTLLSVLQQNNGRYGAAGICNGGGGASAMVIEYLP